MPWRSPTVVVPVMQPPTATSLKRTLTLPLLVLYGLGVTIGAGIYVLIGAAALEADQPHRSRLSWPPSSWA